MKNGVNNKGNVTGGSKHLATVVSLIILGMGLCFLFFTVDAWAVKAFARPILASALIAVIDVAVFLVAIALAPSLSWVIGLVTRRF